MPNYLKKITKDDKFHNLFHVIWNNSHKSLCAALEL